jgi:hypothetical protein
MPAGRFVMRPSRCAANSRGVDVLAIVLGIATFAILLFLIEGIDWV